MPEQDKKDYDSKKRVGGLLSSTLTEIKESYKMSKDNQKQMIQSIDETFDEYKSMYEDSLKVVIPHVTPIGSEIITTATLMDMAEQANNLLNIEFDIKLIQEFKEAVSDVQTVVAAGPGAQQVKIGDKVRIRMQDFVRVINPNSVNRQEAAEVPLEYIDGRTYLSFHERNLKYIINEVGS